MKKMSKIIAVCAVAVMVLGSTLTAFAATSTATVSATATEVSNVSAVTSNGTTVAVSAVTETKVVEAQQAAVALCGAVTGSLQIEKCFELTAEITAPTNITMAVPGITAGQNVIVLHQKHDGTWESVPVVSVDGGLVTATFTSLSPVAIITYAAAPSTGESFPIVAVVALGSFAGAAICAKKYIFG